MGYESTSSCAEDARSSPLGPWLSRFAKPSLSLSYAESQGLMWGLLKPFAYFTCDLR